MMQGADPRSVPAILGQWILAALGLLACLTPQRCTAADGPAAERPLVVLVNGMVEDLAKPSAVWGQLVERDGRQQWTGMVGFLEGAGYRFGGVVQPRRSSLELPRDLDLSGVVGEAATADCFWLQYSANASTEGLALKAMELASAVEKLRKFTGRTRVFLVAHSAGGLVARAYLQSAFPDVLSFRHDVERLITVASPHLGSALAEHWGDWVGTRATSLKTTASLLRDLNEELELPADVCFASIVVRGIWNDVGGVGRDYDDLVDHEFLATLPVDFREGGDQVLSVRTQNLRLARCAARYESATGCGVQYVVARVRKRPDELIHNSALSDGQVQGWVQLLLADDDSCWRGFAADAERRTWIDRQAAACAFTLLEEQTRREHWGAGVLGGTMRVRCLAHDQDQARYRYEGDASWKRRLVGVFDGQTRAAGCVELKSDRFGRIRGWQVPPDVAVEPEAAGTDDTALAREF